MENLHGHLIQACEYYAMIDRYDDAIGNIMDENIALEDDYKKIEHKGFGAAPGMITIIFIGVFSFLFSVISLSMIDSSLAAFISIFIILPLTVGCVLIYKLVYCRARTKEIQQKARQEWYKKYGNIKANNEKAIDHLIDESGNFARENLNVLDFLPDIYRTQLAAAFMERVVRTGRADTLKEAINLFEEQLHRWTLEEQGRQLLQQKELQTIMLQDQLTSILHEQRKVSNSLQNIEALEFYNTFCK